MFAFCAVTYDQILHTTYILLFLGHKVYSGTFFELILVLLLTYLEKGLNTCGLNWKLDLQHT